MQVHTEGILRVCQVCPKILPMYRSNRATYADVDADDDDVDFTIHAHAYPMKPVIF